MANWLAYALLAAACASLVWVFGKLGMQGVQSDLATAVRSVVQAGFVVGFAMTLGAFGHVKELSARPLTLTMIVLSGVAGGLSWIFGFRALQLAQPSQVQPIDKLSVVLTALLAFVFLGDRPSLVNWLGIAMLAVGAYLSSLPR